MSVRRFYGTDNPLTRESGVRYEGLTTHQLIDRPIALWPMEDLSRDVMRDISSSREYPDYLPVKNHRHGWYGTHVWVPSMTAQKTAFQGANFSNNTTNSVAHVPIDGSDPWLDNLSSFTVELTYRPINTSANMSKLPLVIDAPIAHLGTAKWKLEVQKIDYVYHYTASATWDLPETFTGAAPTLTASSGYMFLAFRYDHLNEGLTLFVQGGSQGGDTLSKASQVRTGPLTPTSPANRGLTVGRACQGYMNNLAIYDYPLTDDRLSAHADISLNRHMT